MENQFNVVKPGHGVYEWADYSYNIGTGCSNNCRYCYACELTQEMALNAGKVFTRANWKNEKVKPWKVKIHQAADGTVMFPSMHDITPNYLPIYMKTLRNILDADNPVVVVTKPRLDCIREICQNFTDHKDYMLFRMTITSLDSGLAGFWEPGAPLPQERLTALQLAFNSRYQTSVSVEPMIDSVERTIELYHAVLPYVTEDIWFGKMNEIDQRVDMADQGVQGAVKVIREQQSDANIWRLYEQLQGAEKVAWKDSIRKVVGI